LSRSLHILFLSSWYPNRIQPTLGNFVQKHAEAVARLHKVSALHACSDEKLNEKFEIVESEKDNVYTVNVYFKPSANPFIHFSRYMNAHRLGYDLIRKNRGEMNIIHHNILFPAGLFALKLKRESGLPYLVTENWTGYLPQNSGAYKGFFRKRSTKKIAKGADLLTPVSLDLQNAMQKHGFSNKYEIVYNVVDTHLFKPPVKINEKPFHFLHVSTLKDEHKNISGILRSYSHLLKKQADVKFTFIGDGDSKPHQNYALELGIPSEKIIFLGEQNPTNVSKHMQTANAFVLFSNYENLPCVMVEAMASGLPVIATRVGGIPEHLSKEFGFLVDARDEQGLLYSMEKVIAEKNNFDPVKISSYAAANFSYEAIGKKFDVIYRKLPGIL
jgi:L-malate glycosyltransferase